MTSSLFPTALLAIMQTGHLDKISIKKKESVGLHTMENDAEPNLLPP